MKAATMALCTVFGLGTAAMIGCNEPQGAPSEDSVEQASSALTYPGGGTTGGTTSGEDHGPFSLCPNLSLIRNDCPNEPAATCDGSYQELATALTIYAQRVAGGAPFPSDAEVLSLVRGRSCAVTATKDFLALFRTKSFSPPTTELACNANVLAYKQYIPSCAEYVTFRTAVKTLGNNPYFFIKYGNSADMSMDLSGTLESMGYVYMDPERPKFTANTGSTARSTVSATDATSNLPIANGVAFLKGGAWTGFLGTTNFVRFTSELNAQMYPGKLCVTKQFTIGQTATCLETGTSLVHPSSPGAWACVMPTASQCQ